MYIIGSNLLTNGLTERPRLEDSIDENGIRTIVEFTVNEAGKKVKVRFCLIFQNGCVQTNQLRLPGKPVEFYKNLLSNTMSLKERTGRNLVRKKETNLVQIDRLRQSERKYI